MNIQDKNIIPINIHAGSKPLFLTEEDRDGMHYIYISEVDFTDSKDLTASSSI
jgi:hypothetical protein